MFAMAFPPWLIFMQINNKSNAKGQGRNEVEHDYYLTY